MSSMQAGFIYGGNQRSVDVSWNREKKRRLGIRLSREIYDAYGQHDKSVLRRSNREHLLIRPLKPDDEDSGFIIKHPVTDYPGAFQYYCDVSGITDSFIGATASFTDRPVELEVNPGEILLLVPLPDEEPIPQREWTVLSVLKRGETATSSCLMEPGGRVEFRRSAVWILVTETPEGLVISSSRQLVFKLDATPGQVTVPLGEEP